MWTEKINMLDLHKIDMIIRDLMNTYHAKYKLQINSSLYLPRSMGGRGLKQFEMTYKITKIKSAVKVITDKVPKMKLVQRCDMTRKQKKRSSFMVQLDLQKKILTPPLNQTMKVLHTHEKSGTIETISDIAVLRKVLKSQYRNTLLDKLCKSNWQERMNDNDLVADKCFMWLSKWKACPVEVINDIQSIYFQTVPTLTFKKFRGQSEISSTSCRLCDSNSQESVKHLLSYCGKSTTSIYIKHHNRVLQFILFHVLHMYSLIDKCPRWFVNIRIKPHYENEDLILLLDIPEYSGVDEEEDDKLLRPDGKLILKKKKIVYVLEMSVPWISNREKKK